MLDTNFLRELEAFIEFQQNNLVHADYSLYKSADILEAEVELESFIKTNRKASFQELLLSFIDESGATDPEIYKKAGLDRKHFSKIRKPTYQPSKPTVLLLILALELSLEEAEELLQAAGFALSDSDITDLVIQYCLDKAVYDIDEVNIALEHVGLRPL